MSARPFRFMVTARNAPSAAGWREKARKLEALGYDTLNMPDHLSPQFATVPALMAAADATTKLRVSALVFANDYRNPVLFAKEMATLDVLSGGRLDVAVGTGWYEPDYAMMGIPLDPPRTRFARLAEAVPLLKRLWTEEKVDHAGRFYATKSATVLPRPIQQPHPPILIGASRQAMLRLAGRHADILSYVFPSERRGAVEATDLTAAALEEKLGIVRAAAGGRFGAITLNVQCELAITDDARRRYDETAAKLGIPVMLLRESPFYLFGSRDMVRDGLIERRERFGATFHRVAEADIDLFAPLVASLADA